MAGRCRTFFEPIKIHLEPPDFPVQAIRCAVRCNRFGATFAFNPRLGLGLVFYLPLANLYRMDSELLGYSVDCRHPAHRFKSYFGLERRQVGITLLRFTHGLPVSLDSALT